MALHRLPEQRFHFIGRSEGARDSVRAAFGRALRNSAWLLGGKGVGGLLSLVYLGIVAQSLGVEGFGVFATVLAFGQTIASVVSFQAWQTVIRYGAQHIADGKMLALRKVLSFTVLLDLGASALGAVLAGLGAALVGPALGWSAEEQMLAGWFGLSLLFGQRGTPTGILRLFGRFDLAAYGDLSQPLTRLLGTALAWVADAGLAGYLGAWAASELVTTAVLWAIARRELRRRDVSAWPPAFRGLRAENPRLWYFSLTTNLSASIGLVWQQVPVLAVGWVTGPAGAAGYRMAAQLGTALTKPVTSLARAIYPELAKLNALHGVDALRPVLLRSALLTTTLGAVAVLLIVLAGDRLLLLVGGQAYVFAYPVLLLLTLASAVNLAGFGLEPALVAIGQPGWSLAMRGLASVIYVVLLCVLLTGMGPIGAAWATLMANACSVLLLHLAFRKARNVPAQT